MFCGTLAWLDMETWCFGERGPQGAQVECGECGWCEDAAAGYTVEPRLRIYIDEVYALFTSGVFTHESWVHVAAMRAKNRNRAKQTEY